MKRKHVIAITVVGLFTAIVYVLPIVVSSFKARPLYGNFDIKMKCMAGHETFLFLAESEAFENCPGHRDMSLMGRIERSGNSVTIYSKHNDAPWCRVDFDGSNYSLVSLDDSNVYDLPQVNNPWRTWLPLLLPEH